MTAQELVEQVKRAILTNETGKNQLGTFARTEQWIRLYYSEWDKNSPVEKAANILIEQGVLKPDNRKHAGAGENKGDRYRISRGWWNRNHRVDK